MPSFIRKFRIAFSVVVLLSSGQLFAQIVVNSFTPASAVPGTTMTITGENFNSTMAANTVHIGQVRATVTGVNIGAGVGDDTLTVTVPTGAVYGRISVTNTGTRLSDRSRQFFVPVFTPALSRALKTSDFVGTVLTNQPTTAYAVTAADLNNDGKVDLVLSEYSSGGLAFRLNTSTVGTLSFGAEQSLAISGFAGGIQDHDVGDIDGDGILDIVAVSLNTERYVVLQGTGTALTFNQFSFPVHTTDPDVDPQTIALVDVDSDGRLDVVVGHNSTPGISVFLSTTLGSTITFTSSAHPTSTNAVVGLAIADYNADGKDDILAVRNAPNTANVLENNSPTVGTVSFLTPAPFAVDGTDAFPNSVIAGDLDGDVDIDAIVPFSEPGRTEAGILTNTSAGTIALTPTAFAGVGGSQQTAALGDLNGDGKPDLVLPIDTGSYDTVVYTNSSAGSIAFNNKLSLTSSGGISPRNSVVADFDGDNRPDILVYHTNTANISLFRNNPVLAPATQATDVAVPNTTLLPTQASISWTRGSGQRVVVFMKATASTSDVPVPVDLETYSVSPTFGAGDQIPASGWYAVATGTGTSATVTGLTQNTAYRVMVVEYNNNATNGAEVYQTATATGNPLNFTTPVPVSITSMTRAQASPTNAATRTYTVTLGGNVYAGMVAARFSITPTGSIAGASVASVTGSGATYTVTVNTGTGSGNLTLNFNTSTGIVPGISTTLPFAGETYAIDRTAPTLSTVTIASDNVNPSAALIGDDITLSFTASEAIGTPTVTLAGQTVTANNGSGNNWTAVYTLTSGNAAGGVTFSIAFSDLLGNAGSAVSTTTNASAVGLSIPAPPPQLSGSLSGRDIVGPVVILAGTVIDGGSLTGSISNSGLITGTVTLGPGTLIGGGTLSGDIRGNPGSPALLQNVTILANTHLEHVIITWGTILSPDAVIGAGVRFESPTLIPPGLDLTGALSPFRWAGSDAVTVVNLGTDVLRIPVRDILNALRQLPGQGNVELGAGGEVVTSAQSSRGMLLPVRVRQAAAGTAPGTYTDGDGNLLFVTEEGREVLVYPVLLADASLDSELASRGMSFAYDELGRVRVAPPQAGSYLVGRAGLVAVPAFHGVAPGLYAYPLEAPAGVSGYSLIFRDEDGTLMEQELVPAPANWSSLKTALGAIPGVGDVALDAEGVITVEFSGRSIRGRTAYQVLTGSIAGLPTLGASLQWAGDLNGDGVGDYRIFYPSGDVQVLFVYP